MTKLCPALARKGALPGPAVAHMLSTPAHPRYKSALPPPHAACHPLHGKHARNHATQVSQAFRRTKTVLATFVLLTRVAFADTLPRVAQGLGHAVPDRSTGDNSAFSEPKVIEEGTQTEYGDEQRRRGLGASTAAAAPAYRPQSRAAFEPRTVSCNLRAVVTIPAVRKGISNQRMRIVQDIASAVALGLAVRLPRALTSRRACNHDANCYNDYLESYVSIWSVYDRELTLEALRRTGVCVVKDDLFDDELREDDVGVVAPLQWPIAMSDLAAHSATISSWIAATNATASFALADSRYCCTLLIPDSTAAVEILAEINGAFVAAERIREHATYVLQAYRARLTALQRARDAALSSTGNMAPTSKEHDEAHAIVSTTRPLICAAHWRDNDDFVVEPEHNLDRTAYGRVMAAALASLPNCRESILLLGDVPTRRLDGIRKTLAQARCSELIDVNAWEYYYRTQLRAHGDGSSRQPTHERRDLSEFIRYNESCLAAINAAVDREDAVETWAPRLFTKQSLIDLRRLNWAAEYGGLDDLLAMVDFEIGKRVDLFLGSPFSSFSALIAFSRIDNNNNNIDSENYDLVPSFSSALSLKMTIMPPQLDVDDNLAKLLRIQFPHHPSAVAPDPCASLVAVAPKLAKRLARKSCAFDAPPLPLPEYTKEVINGFNTFTMKRKLDCYLAIFRMIAPYCSSLAPRGLVVLLAFVVTIRPRRAAKPLIATLILGLIATLLILFLCHYSCPDLSSGSSRAYPSRRGFGEDLSDYYGLRGPSHSNDILTVAQSRGGNVPNHLWNAQVRRKDDYANLGGSSLSYYSMQQKHTSGSKVAQYKLSSPASSANSAEITPRSWTSQAPERATTLSANGPSRLESDGPAQSFRIAVVSSNFGINDALSSAPRQRGSSKVSFFLFASTRDLLAALRGWTLVLPIRLAPREQLRQHEQWRASYSHKAAAIVYSRSWDEAIERINNGRQRWDRVATGAYPLSSRQLVELPFDLESLEYTTRYGIGPEYEDAQNLVDVMAPKFVKLQMFRIDVLQPYNFLIWADASLVLDTAAVSRALRPLIGRNADLVVQPHPKRNSTLQELKHILEVQNQNRFKPIAPYLRAQLEHYVNDTDFTDEHGLYWMAYFGARRNNRTIDFFDRWWLEVRRWQFAPASDSTR